MRLIPCRVHHSLTVYQKNQPLERYLFSLLCNLEYLSDI
nr:MAG TPA: hypothetical protein [Caudoviricetes sp.]